MKHYKYIFEFVLSIFLIMQINISFGQTRTIYGKVINVITGAPIPDIKVEIKGTNISTVSNSSGEYSLIVPDTIKSIIFSDFARLEVIEIKIINPNQIEIYLTEIEFSELSLEDLMNVKITTAGKIEQQISDIPASVVVITRADIEAYGYQSLKEILSNALGMYKIDDYKNTSFGVRGFYSNVYSRNIIFMINGIIQQQPYQNWNDLNLMNLQVESIERIEFVRGPLAIIYGICKQILSS